MLELNSCICKIKDSSEQKLEDWQSLWVQRRRQEHICYWVIKKEVEKKAYKVWPRLSLIEVSLSWEERT